MCVYVKVWDLDTDEQSREQWKMTSQWKVCINLSLLMSLVQYNGLILVIVCSRIFPFLS